MTAAPNWAERPRQSSPSPESATKVKTLVDEVNLGSQEQAQGIEQIAKAISQMEQVTQKTAASAEEGAAASQELNTQADAMKAAVGQLRVVVGAEGALSVQPRRAVQYAKGPVGEVRKTASREIGVLKKAIASHEQAARRLAPNWSP